ncbi:MAG: hypothetical protein WBE14_10535, partial [Xanthobacteraceae bacterium]
LPRYDADGGTRSMTSIVPFLTCFVSLVGEYAPRLCHLEERKPAFRILGFASQIEALCSVDSVQLEFIRMRHLRSFPKQMYCRATAVWSTDPRDIKIALDSRLSLTARAAGITDHEII